MAPRGTTSPTGNGDADLEGLSGDNISGGDSAVANAGDSDSPLGDSASGDTTPAAGDAQSGDDAEAGVAVTILTINIQNAFIRLDALSERTQAIIDLIDSEEPLFVALQEVVENPLLENRAAVIAAATEYDYRFVKTHDLGGWVEEGIAILSRYPILFDTSVSLPHSDLSVISRAVQAVRADTPHGELWFFNAHMTIQPLAAIKADQAVAILELIAAQSFALPAFFAGDLNATPDTLAMGVLRGEETHNGLTGAFVDAWPAVHPDDPGFTSPYPGAHQRIDYIYAVPGSDGIATPRDCDIVFEQQVAGEYVSDHLGVICRFGLYQ